MDKFFSFILISLLVGSTSRCVVVEQTLSVHETHQRSLLSSSANNGMEIQI